MKKYKHRIRWVATEGGVVHHKDCDTQAEAMAFMDEEIGDRRKVVFPILLVEDTTEKEHGDEGKG